MGEEPDLVTFELQFPRGMSQEVWGTYLTFGRLERLVVASNWYQRVGAANRKLTTFHGKLPPSVKCGLVWW